jgi:ATP-dependent Lhr-like helicase
MQGPDGRWRLRDPRAARRIRMNVGTIVQAETLSVRAGGRRLGEIEESFAASLRPGETFLIGGEVVEFQAIRDMSVLVTPSNRRQPRIAAFSGAKLAVSTFLAHRVMETLNDPACWADLPPTVADWLRWQTERSETPSPEDLLIETFPRGDRWHLTAYAFAGRNAHQTLGLLITRRMEEAGLDPLGFVADDYALAIWGLSEVTDPAALFAAQGLREGLEQWFADSAVMKRTFRGAAIVAGLIERNLPGRRKTGRQATFSSDILYDTLRRYDPGHLLLQITRREAMRGMVDFDRIEEMLTRSGRRIRHVRTDRVTPLSAPILMEVGKVSIRGAADERLLAEEAALLGEAMR